MEITAGKEKGKNGFKTVAGRQTIVWSVVETDRLVTRGRLDWQNRRTGRFNHYNRKEKGGLMGIKPAPDGKLQLLAIGSDIPTITRAFSRDSWKLGVLWQSCVIMIKSPTAGSAGVQCAFAIDFRRLLLLLLTRDRYGHAHAASNAHVANPDILVRSGIPCCWSRFGTPARCGSGTARSGWSSSSGARSSDRCRTEHRC